VIVPEFVTVRVPICDDVSPVVLDIINTFMVVYRQPFSFGCMLAHRGRIIIKFN
jgi:hypothetical protein